jgi:DNA-binding MarR family transcriptional regulator
MITDSTGPAAAPAVLASLRALGAELDHLDEVAARVYGLNRTDMRALDVLGRTGPLTPTDLAKALGFTTGGVTTVIDRLERAGYVVRRSDPADRRRLTVSVTEATRRRDAAVFGALAEATETAVRAHSDDELELLWRFLDTVRGIVSSHVDALEERPR